MIGRLQGTVVDESPDGTVVVDVNGVGYEVLVPLGTLGRCTHGDNRTVTLSVVTHVREDAITLFGFSDDRERSAFRLLTAVAGVGPRTAVAVLSALPATELAATITRGDAKRLQGVSGVGKRIAERLVLELKDKLSGLPSNGAQSVSRAVGDANVAAVVTDQPGQSSAMRPASVTGQLVATLERLGFKTAEAERVAEELGSRSHEPLETLVRDALKRLVK